MERKLYFIFRVRRYGAIFFHIFENYMLNTFEYIIKFLYMLRLGKLVHFVLKIICVKI